MSKATKDKTWATAITEISPNRVAVRGYDIAKLMGRVSFGQAVYLILRGELPDERVGRLMDAILVSSIDHGVTPPSALAARSVTSTGGALSASVAAGIMNINQYHGGAIEDCAHQLNHIVRHRNDTGKALDVVAEAMLGEMKETGTRMSGFGHRIHTDDPRAARLFELAREAGVDGPHMEAKGLASRPLAKILRRFHNENQESAPAGFFLCGNSPLLAVCSPSIYLILG